MKISKFGVIIFLISILIVVLFLSTFIGAVHQEGMTGRELILVKSLLLETDPSKVISSIKDVKIQDSYFKNIIDSNATDEVKVSQLKRIINELSESKIEGNDIPSSWSQSLIYNTPAPLVTAAPLVTTTAAPTTKATAAPTTKATAAPTTNAIATTNPVFAGRICEYSFDKLDSKSNIFNSVSSSYDLTLVNAGVTSSTITRTSIADFPNSLYQNAASKNNFSYYVNNTNKGIKTLTGSFSVSFWCYIDSKVTSSVGLVWSLYNEPTGTLITFTQATTGAPVIVITLSGQKFYIGAIQYTKDAYNHLVITCDKSGNTSNIMFYVNGTLYNYNGSNYSQNKPGITWNGSNTITTTGNLFDGANTALYVLGGPHGKGLTWPANSSSESNGFNGYISKLYVYNRALTQTDVTYLKNSR